MKRNTSLLLLIMFLTGLLVGCSGDTGILPDPIPETLYVTPTIQHLQVENTTISKCGGGILYLSCEWSSPYKVTTATAYLGFVKTIKNPTTEPVGVIGSQTATITASLLPQFLAQTVTASDTCTASDTEAFFAKYALPIVIPTKIGTVEKFGRWEVEIPFAPDDTSIAPLGVYQMIFYMDINSLKTNTLSFEITFIP